MAFKPTSHRGLKDRRVTAYVSRRMVVEWEMSRQGIRRIAMGPELASACRQVVTQRALPYAVRISPHGRTGEYSNSWEPVDGHIVIAGMRRVACKLRNNAPHAAAVEWGRGGKRGVLTRTLAHLNSTSPIGIAKAVANAAAKASRKPWNTVSHPRGPGGRFAPKTASPDVLKSRAARAAQSRDKS